MVSILVSVAVAVGVEGDVVVEVAVAVAVVEDVTVVVVVVVTVIGACVELEHAILVRGGLVRAENLLSVVELPISVHLLGIIVCL